jgi:hypothetical protein
VETENPSACATVNCKVCKSAIALYLNVIKRTSNQSANPIIPTRNRHFSHVYHPTCDNILILETTQKEVVKNEVMFLLYFILFHLIYSWFVVGTNFADKRRSLGIVCLRTKSHRV